MLNITIHWLTAQSERTGKAVKELIDAGPKMGNGTLYDRLVILFNLPHWKNVDYQRIISHWLKEGKRDAVTKKGGPSKVIQRKAKKAEEKKSRFLHKDYRPQEEDGGTMVVASPSIGVEESS